MSSKFVITSTIDFFEKPCLTIKTILVSAEDKWQFRSEFTYMIRLSKTFDDKIIAVATLVESDDEITMLLDPTTDDKPITLNDWVIEDYENRTGTLVYDGIYRELTLDGSQVISVPEFRLNKNIDLLLRIHSPEIKSKVKDLTTYATIVHNCILYNLGLENPTPKNIIDRINHIRRETKTNDTRLEVPLTDDQMAVLQEDHISLCDWILSIGP